MQMMGVMPKLHVVLAGAQSGQTMKVRQDHRLPQTLHLTDCCAALQSRTSHGWRGVPTSLRQCSDDVFSVKHGRSRIISNRRRHGRRCRIHLQGIASHPCQHLCTLPLVRHRAKQDDLALSPGRAFRIAVDQASKAGHCSQQPPKQRAGQAATAWSTFTTSYTLSTRKR